MKKQRVLKQIDNLAGRVNTNGEENEENEEEEEDDDESQYEG
jgi:hypothetical protein